MSRVNLDYDEAHAFVIAQRALGANVRWDGWTMVYWSPTEHGYTNPKGAFLEDQLGRRSRGWGMEYRIDPSDKGEWSVPKKYVRNAR
jgi:hypothetical protein